MSGEKIKVEFEVDEDSQTLLEEMVEKYELPDINKALRILLDYLAEDGDQDEIFGVIRCRRCDD